ncbi:MAG TPA: peptide-methionine (R)-S-oxide reductase MsrB [Candidatus Saccharimonadales bacterium]|nr:peptide-methionine (R)-S-oxide reductase MsrB [Candidatus Saccharimonadales bacterium]
MTVQLSEDEWRKKLTPEQYHVLREKGTEFPYSGKLLHNRDDGLYRCAACGAVLFNSKTKMDSLSGWPSFNDAIKGSVVFQDDDSYGMHRTEVTCANCGSHLGHVFDNPHDQTTGQYYCIDSVALNFQPKDEKGGAAKDGS